MIFWTSGDFCTWIGCSSTLISPLLVERYLLCEPLLPELLGLKYCSSSLGGGDWLRSLFSSWTKITLDSKPTCLLWSGCRGWFTPFESICLRRLITFVLSFALTSAGFRVSRCVPSGGTLLNGFSSLRARSWSSSQTAYKLRFLFHSLFPATWLSLRVFMEN